MLVNGSRLKQYNSTISATSLKQFCQLKFENFFAQLFVKTRIDKAALAKESAKSSLSHRRPSPLPPPGANFGFSQCKTKEMVKLALGARCLGLPSAKLTIGLKTSASDNFKFLSTKLPRL
jgi:hypothetical protein